MAWLSAQLRVVGQATDQRSRRGALGCYRELLASARDARNAVTVYRTAGVRAVHADDDEQRAPKRRSVASRRSGGGGEVDAEPVVYDAGHVRNDSAWGGEFDEPLPTLLPDRTLKLVIYGVIIAGMVVVFVLGSFQH